MLVRTLVYLSHECAGVETERVISLLELVQLFYDGNRNDNVIILELLYCIKVMKYDVGVQNKYLGHGNMWLIFPFQGTHQGFKYAGDVRFLYTGNGRSTWCGVSQGIIDNVLQNKFCIYVVVINIGNLQKNSGDF